MNVGKQMYLQCAVAKRRGGYLPQVTVISSRATVTHSESYVGGIKAIKDGKKTVYHKSERL